MVDYSKIKTLLIDEYTSVGNRSQDEIRAFHSGLNYLIDYISNEDNEERLNDYVPNEVIFNQENSRRAVRSIKQEYLKKEENIIENYRLRLKVKEILLERRLEALRIKKDKEIQEKCLAIRDEYELKINDLTQQVSKLKQRIFELEIGL